ncbi:MAG: 23S rRNA (guanosine(2251)-2'-O)-methyltransferase RlmB [Gammaproteobacteria bacterium]|nr:23S rRNA (guanosine(2251)-2'-O)-methyltransferase RlmB [Gammaproteobacteria bacterium]
MSEWVCGIHACQALLEQSPESVDRLVFVRQQNPNPRLLQLQRLADKLRVKAQFVSRREMDEQVDGENHQGVAILRQISQAMLWDEHQLEVMLDNLTEPPLLLILDGIQDPHNLGACMRSADAAGVHAVIAPKDNAVGMTATARKVACGAAEHVPFVQVTNIARTLENLKQRGIWITGTSLEADQALYQVDFKGATAIVTGAEGKGARRLTLQQCDYLVSIPMRGHVQSLNASVATGICLFEVVRQRTQTK